MVQPSYVISQSIRDMLEATLLSRFTDRYYSDYRRINKEDPPPLEDGNRALMEAMVDEAVITFTDTLLRAFLELSKLHYPVNTSGGGPGYCHSCRLDESHGPGLRGTRMLWPCYTADVIKKAMTEFDRIYTG